MVCSSS